MRKSAIIFNRNGTLFTKHCQREYKNMLYDALYSHGCDPMFSNPFAVRGIAECFTWPQVHKIIGKKLIQPFTQGSFEQLMNHRAKCLYQ